MKNSRDLCMYFIVLLFVLVPSAFGQSKQELASTKCQEAIRLMDSGKVDESIVLLNEAIKLDPKETIYPYELAFAYCLKEDYKTAVKILEKLRKSKEPSELVYQLLGNSYDMLGKPEKALETYADGLEKYPNSGCLNMESGTVYWIHEQYDKAVSYYEKGIEVDPEFPSNYYRVATAYCHSDAEVWGMIYGEIFMNLERNTQRTSEMSRLLYNTYKSEITFPNDSVVNISFCKNMSMTLEDLEELKIPFGMVYETIMSLAVGAEKNIDINSLDRIRTRFVENYYREKYNEKYPNVLFDYQNKLKAAGHMEAYNHWLLKNGDEDAFSKWLVDNASKWGAFAKWMDDNPLLIDEEHKFSSSQY